MKPSSLVQKITWTSRDDTLRAQLPSEPSGMQEKGRIFPMGPVWTGKSGLVDKGSQNIAACDIWEVGGER